MGTNWLGVSFTNSNNTLGMLESLGFASGLSLPLGIITTLVNDWVHLQHQNNNKKYCKRPSALPRALTVMILY